MYNGARVQSRYGTVAVLGLAVNQGRRPCLRSCNVPMPCAKESIEKNRINLDKRKFTVYIRWFKIALGVQRLSLGLVTSVSDPHPFYADPDPTLKTKCGSGFGFGSGFMP